MRTLITIAAFVALPVILLAADSAGLRPGDQFEMRLSGMPAEYAAEFSGTYTLGEDGNVSVPFVGAVRAAGLTPSQLAVAIQNKLISEKIFTNPTALINLPQATRTVTIGGEVRSPQAMAYSPDLTLNAAVMRAGGATEFGSLKKVKVTRDGKSTVYNLTKKDKDPSQNPRLLPGDEVQVQ